MTNTVIRPEGPLGLQQQGHVGSIRHPNVPGNSRINLIRAKRTFVERERAKYFEKRYNQY